VLLAALLHEAQLFKALHHTLRQVVAQMACLPQHALPLRRHDRRHARLLLCLSPLRRLFRLLW
jgi:hypothetical protein